MSNFNLYSRYYDLLYCDKDTYTECDYVTSILKLHEPNGNNWIEFGAGSGRHGSIFKELGIQWTGIEKSPDMAAQCKAKGLEVYVGNIEDYSLSPRFFDVVLSLFHVISYLPTNQDVIKTFKCSPPVSRCKAAFLKVLMTS